MDLNAAVLSKRGRKVIEVEMMFDFERVLAVQCSSCEMPRTLSRTLTCDHYAGLNPILDGDGLWKVGQRLKNNKPMTLDSYFFKTVTYPSSSYTTHDATCS